MGRSTLSVVVLPRDRNPYQELLYVPLRARGVRVCYLGELTASRTVNVLALPVELVVRRALGQADVVHLHWVFAFALPWRRRVSAARLVSQIVFAVFLFAARSTRTPVVWTAHNVLPHDPVLRNDLTGRRWLVRDARLVIGHGPETFRGLERLGLRPRRSVIIAHGPIPPVRPVAPVVPHPGPRRFLFVGNIAEYKGVADLLEAWRRVEADVHLVIAGSCDDEDFGSHIARLVARDARVHLDLRWLTDAELAQTLDRADVVVLPFRRVTTTGSLMLVAAAGRPVILPDLPELTDVPDAAAFRYNRTVSGLARAVSDAAAASWSTLAEMGAACRAHVETRSWDAIADCTLVELRHVVRRAGAEGSVTSIRTGTEP